VGALHDDPPLAVEPLAGRDQELRQRRLGVEVVDALQVVVGEVGEVDLVEDLAVGRRVGLPRACAVAALVGVGEAAERARRPGRVDGRVDDAVGEVEVVGRVCVEVREERAEKAEYEGDQGQRQQRVEVVGFEPQPARESRPGSG
jgi:hypothetical protein